MIKVLIVDSNERLAEVMRQLLDDDPRFTVGPVVSIAADVLPQAVLANPDVVLIPPLLHGRPGEALCEELRAVAPRAALLMWTNDASSDTALEASCFDGRLERGITYAALSRAIRLAHERTAFIDARVVALTVASPSHA